MKHKVTCLNCEGWNYVYIEDDHKGSYLLDFNRDHLEREPFIISGRYRGDMEFGWECICGNTSLVARQEMKDVDKLVVGGGRSAIERIVNSLKVEDANKFKMEKVSR